MHLVEHFEFIRAVFFYEIVSHAIHKQIEIKKYTKLKIKMKRSQSLPSPNYRQEKNRRVIPHKVDPLEVK